MLTGLTPFTSYSVQVAAVNDGGTGPYSDPALTVETLQDGECIIIQLRYKNIKKKLHKTDLSDLYAFLINYD